ncbi:LOW QUALITY PROTEIN: hypothetical protein HID58_033500, partial [Brassica napus]
GSNRCWKKLTNKRLVSLIGCCAEGDERLLVAEEKQRLPWGMRGNAATSMENSCRLIPERAENTFHLPMYVPCLSLLCTALDIIRGKNALLLIDSSLGNMRDATTLVELASKFLQSEAKDRPDTKFLLSGVAPLLKKEEV